MGPLEQRHRALVRAAPFDWGETLGGDFSARPVPVWVDLPAGEIKRASITFIYLYIHFFFWRFIFDNLTNKETIKRKKFREKLKEVFFPF